MLRFALLFACCLLVRCEDSLTTDQLRNTPLELSNTHETQAVAGSQVEARFLPFAASFSLNPGGTNAQTFSIAGSPEGIGLSQSSSHGSGISGTPGSFSASQSSSIAAGLDGISASDSNSFAHNHPLYGPQSQASGNSFSVGQAGASSHGDVVNGQATSGAQSSVGGVQTQASSGASQNLVHPRPGRPAWNNVPARYPNEYNVPPSYGNEYEVSPTYASGYNGDYYHNSQRPTLTISVTDDKHRYHPQPSNGWYESRDSYDQPDYCKYYNGWYRDPRCRSPRVTIAKPGTYYRPDYANRGPYYENIRDTRHQQAPSIQVSNAHAGSSAQSGPGGSAIGQSSSQSTHDYRGPSSSTTNHVQSSGNAQTNAQGASGSINFQPNQLQASLSSGSISANSRPGGFSQGSSHSSSSKGSSSSQLHGSSSGGGSTHGSATSGSVVVFPGPSSQKQIIPKEFVRSNKRSKDESPFDELITDLTDTVYDIFDY